VSNADVWVTIRFGWLADFADATPTIDAAASNATPMLSMNRESRDFLCM